MNNSTYQSLIDDTILYLKNLLPKEKKCNIPSVNESEKISSVPEKKKISSSIVSKEKSTYSSPIPINDELKDSEFKLEPPPIPFKEPTESFRKILQEIDPHLFLHKNPPDDCGAKRIKNAWKVKRDTPNVSILYQESQYRPFLENIAKAIDITFGTCRLITIEQNKKWDLFLESPNLKAIIAPDHLIFDIKELLPFYRENPQEKVRHLGNIPLLLLPDLSLYYKDPYLKRSLWNVIIQNLQPLF